MLPVKYYQLMADRGFIHGRSKGDHLVHVKILISCKPDVIKLIMNRLAQRRKTGSHSDRTGNTTIKYCHRTCYTGSAREATGVNSSTVNIQAFFYITHKCLYLWMILLPGHSIFRIIGSRKNVSVFLSKIFVFFKRQTKDRKTTRLNSSHAN